MDNKSTTTFCGMAICNGTSKVWYLSPFVSACETDRSLINYLSQETVCLLFLSLTAIMALLPNYICNVITYVCIALFISDWLLLPKKKLLHFLWSVDSFNCQIMKHLCYVLEILFAFYRVFSHHFSFQPWTASPLQFGCSSFCPFTKQLWRKWREFTLCAMSCVSAHHQCPTRDYVKSCQV